MLEAPHKFFSEMDKHIINGKSDLQLNNCDRAIYIHHIHPRELGGDNDFDNFVPVLREVHQSEFNGFWRNW